MKYFIITGTSRGIGEALAKQLLDDNHHIFCISRAGNQRLIEAAEQSNCRLSCFPFDLNHVSSLQAAR